jgi:hypothetical protein
MGTSYNPHIVSDGLVLCLDAANPRSYPGSGNTWYDLSGNENNGTINNATFSSSARGSFYFDGTYDYIECAHSSSLNITSEITIEYTVYPTWNTGYTPIIGKRSGDGLTETYTTWIGNDKQLDYMARPISDKRPLFNGSSFFVENNWYYISVVSASSGNIYAYVNGIVKSSTTGGGVGSFNTEPLRIGYVPSVGVLGDGYIGYVKIYNHALSAKEISQNFNATRGRYGI